MNSFEKFTRPLLTHSLSRRRILGGLTLAATTLTAAGASTSAFARNKKRPTSRLIKNGFIYAADQQNTVHPDGWLLIKDDKIAAIGSSSDPAPEADDVVNANGKMVLPGFVNPHWHESFVAPNFEKPDDSGLTPSPYAKGGNIEALGGFFGFLSTIGKILTPEEAVAIARWSLWTQLRSGTTALGDVGSTNSADGMANAALDLGMRMRVSRWGADIMIPNDASQFVRTGDAKEQADDWEEIMSKWHDHSSGLVSAMPTVMGAFGSSDEQLAALKTVSDKYGSPVASHIAPVKNEREAVTRAFGRAPIARFEEHGLVNDRLMAVHTAWANEAEYKLFLERDVRICHSPAHYGQLGEHTVDTGQIGRFLRDGAKVSSSSDGDISYIGAMPEAMRAAHLGHNEALNDVLACPPTTALLTGTRHGAAALGWEDKLGSLEAGKLADIVLVDISDWRYRLGNHPLRTFLVAGGSQDVSDVIVAGRLVVEAGRSTTLDEETMFADYHKAAASARTRIAPPH